MATPGLMRVQFFPLRERWGSSLTGEASWGESFAMPGNSSSLQVLLFMLVFSREPGTSSVGDSGGLASKAGRGSRVGGVGK